MKRLLLLTLLLAMVQTGAFAQTPEAADVRNETIAKARYLRSIYKTELALNLLASLVDEDEFDEEVGVELAECYYQNGDYMAATGLYMTLVTKAPENTMYRIRLMQSLARMKAYDNSIRIGKFIFRQDSIPVIAVNIGDSYKQLDMPDSALAYYKKAVALNPYKESFVSKAANMLVANKEYDEAISMAERFLENDPDNDAIAPICGLAYYRKGDYGKAIEIFQKQEDGGNDAYAVHFYLGHAYWRTKSIYKAEKELLAAWQIDSTDANLACSIAGVKSDGYAGFDGEVKPWLDKALEMMQPNAETMARIHQGYALEYFKRHDFDNAIEHYKETYRYDPNFRAAVSTIGYCYEQKKDYKRALEWYEKYLTLVPQGSKGYEQITESINYVKRELFMEEK